MMWDMMAPMWWMMFLWFAVLTLIVIGIVLVIRAASGSSSSGQTNPSDDPNTAVRVLQERFARGEIDENEFQERRRILEESDPGGA